MGTCLQEASEGTEISEPAPGGSRERYLSFKTLSVIRGKGRDKRRSLWRFQFGDSSKEDGRGMQEKFGRKKSEATPPTGGESYRQRPAPVKSWVGGGELTRK